MPANRKTPSEASCAQQNTRKTPIFELQARRPHLYRTLRAWRKTASQMRRSHSVQSGYIEKSQDRKRSVSDIVSWTVNSACTALPSTDGTRRMWEHNSRFPRLPARTAPPTTSWRPAKGPKISTITSLPVSAFGWQLETSEQRCTLWATLPSTRKPSLLISEGQLWR